MILPSKLMREISLVVIIRDVVTDIGEFFHRSVLDVTVRGEFFKLN